VLCLIPHHHDGGVEPVRAGFREVSNGAGMKATAIAVSLS